MQIIEDLTDSTVTAIFLTSVAFGYYHGGFSLGVGNLLANVLGGVLLGLIFAKTRNTWAVTVPHASLVALLLAVA